MDPLYDVPPINIIFFIKKYQDAYSVNILDISKITNKFSSTISFPTSGNYSVERLQASRSDKQRNHAHGLLCMSFSAAAVRNTIPVMCVKRFLDMAVPFFLFYLAVCEKFFGQMYW